MISVDIDQSGADQDVRLREGQIQAIETRVQETFQDRFDGRISVSYVTDHEIRRLNRMYRGKDATTDVLAFSYLDQPAGKGDSLGDVVVSTAQAKRQAEDGDVELELTDLIVHGILHVLGYDHEKPEDAKEMFPLQDRLVKTLL